jgi:hypothetical protein
MRPRNVLLADVIEFKKKSGVESNKDWKKPHSRNHCAVLEPIGVFGTIATFWNRDVFQFFGTQ